MYTVSEGTVSVVLAEVPDDGTPVSTLPEEHPVSIKAEARIKDTKLRSLNFFMTRIIAQYAGGIKDAVVGLNTSICETPPLHEALIVTGVPGVITTSRL